jgi:CheY-like chemotaxis protein
MSEEIKPTILCSLYNEQVQKLTAEILKGRGYEIIITPDSERAIPQVPNAQLIISDVSNGGYKLYDHVNQHFPQTKIIYIDGGLMERERTPNAAFIEKPFSYKDLVALVEWYFPQHLKPKQQP